MTNKELLEKFTVELEKKTVRILPSRSKDVGTIVSMVNSVPDALLKLTEEELNNWIHDGKSLVAITWFGFGKIVGHQGVSVWPNSGYFELRSAVVLPEYRGGGINTRMKLTAIKHIKNNFTDATFVGFTEAASKSRGILERIGFKDLSLDETPEEFFSICPVTCYRKTGRPCGCKVYILNKL